MLTRGSRCTRGSMWTRGSRWSWVVQSLLSFAVSSTPFISPPGSSGRVKRIFLSVWEENQQSQVSFLEVNIL